MTVKILATEQQNSEARSILSQRKISFISAKPSKFWKFWSKKNKIQIGDPYKSWDLLKAVEFIEQNVPKTANILDIGAYASEILCVLQALNYDNLIGIDLNPNVLSMPYATRIDYRICDFMNTPFDNETFQAITAISVIEHGLDIEKLLKEISRLLQPGGYFIGSTDYWNEKINTDGIQIFDMDWKIFSATELTDFIQMAANYNLQLHGECDLSVQDKVISCLGKEYTFAWFVLQKQ